MRQFVILSEKDIADIRSGREVKCHIGTADYILISEKRYEEAYGNKEHK